MRYFLLILFLLTFGQLSAQQRFDIGGYVKDLQSVYLLHPDLPVPGLDTTLVLNTSFLHHRLNTRWSISDALSLKTEFRNRFFWGDELNDAFVKQLDAANDHFDLSLEGSNNNGLAYQLMIDRLYLEFAKGKWEIRLGRQRINWGISTIWNPNDVFNAFSFTDFDYEERPGSDALRVRYFTGFASSVEIAVKAADSWENFTGATLVRLHRWDYDFQILAGMVEKQLTLGGGWAGNLGNAGFKGEFTWFGDSFAATLAADYLTAGSLYLHGGFLYNSNGSTDTNILNLFDFELSASNLYPYKYSLLTQASSPFTPLFNGGLALIYSPSKAHALFINPTFTYSVATNWDLDLVGQLAFDRSGSKYGSPVQALFLRLKFSY